MKQASITRKAVAAAALPALLAGCFGGGSDDIEEPPPKQPSATISGVVADGPLQGAAVCYDLNDNGRCDDADIRAAATTGADGRYTLEVPADRAGRHAVVAEVPATAVDRDTGQPIGAALVWRSPATAEMGSQQVFVSALTTAVAELVATQGLTVVQAAAQVKSALNLGASALADFTAAGGDATAAVAARALTLLAVEGTKLAQAAQVDAAQLAGLQRAVLTTQLEVIGSALAASSAGDTAAKAAEAAAVAKAALNLEAATVAAVAAAVVNPASQATQDAAGPFVSVRRFAYADANQYSYTLFVGDNSRTSADGSFVAHEVRKTLAAGKDQPFNRNQAYWNGSEWVTCALQWEVSTRIKQSTRPDGQVAQSSRYCEGSSSTSAIRWEDLGGQSMRAVIARMRAFPLPDVPGAHTDDQGLPVKWGPDPALLPADAVFPPGAKLNVRQSLQDVGGTERIELTTKSTVRWPDGRYRQATQLEQYGWMPGDLGDPSATPGGANTVFVVDVPLPAQPDAAFAAFKRWRAGFDTKAMKIRFYACDVRTADQASVNCAARGDGTLSMATQGDARVMRVASGYPAELLNRLGQQRFWVERSGTVFRGMLDLPRTRHDQRLNTVAWQALRTTLGIPAHEAPAAPAGPGPFAQLRSFTFTDAANFSLRSFQGDDSVLDAQGYFLADDIAETVVGGVPQPVARHRSYWTGSAWVDCLVGEGSRAIRANSRAPYDSSYCEGYRYERVGGDVTLTLDGRAMSDVVNDIRAYGSKDGSFDYGGWGPNPAVHTQLASRVFPVGATMTYRSNRTLATPWSIATAAADRVRVAPAPNTLAPFASWPFAASLDDVVAKHPGDFQGGALNGNVALYVWGYDLATPSDPAYTTRVEIRVAFDANGKKARFYQNNRSASSGFTTNYQRLLETTYTVEDLGGVRLLKFAAMPDGFEARHGFVRAFAERQGGVWYAFKDSVPPDVTWSIRLNRTAAEALGQALGLQ